MEYVGSIYQRPPGATGTAYDFSTLQKASLLTRSEHSSGCIWEVQGSPLDPCWVKNVDPKYKPVFVMVCMLNSHPCVFQPKSLVK